MFNWPITNSKELIYSTSNLKWFRVTERHRKTRLFKMNNTASNIVVNVTFFPLAFVLIWLAYVVASLQFSFTLYNFISDS